MSTYDPRTLIRVLNVLQEEVQRFTQTSSDTLKQAEYTQSCAQERVNQAFRWSAIANNQVKSDLEDVQEVETEVNSLLSQCSTAVDIAHETVAAVEEAQQQAETTLDYWQDELQLALAWQARAEERLERAIQAFQRAERDFESAKRDLERAEANLERCAKDPERKNCNSEQRAYNNARVAVLQAIEELKVAEIEVHAAQEELEMAKARVRCCQSAVDYAEQAVQHAYLAMEQAEQALNDAERSLESAKSANRAANNAQAKATEAAEEAEQVAIKVRQAETITNEAQWHVQSARSMTDSAHNWGIKGCQELRYRADQLHLLNQGSFGIREKAQKVVASVPALEVKKNISYEDAYNSLDEIGGSVYIRVNDFNNSEIGCIKAERTGVDRVKIKDTTVAKAFQGKGIGTALLRNLEERLSSGTEIYFETNEEPKFWQKKGFKQRSTKDGRTDFFKIIE
jgi:ribosomal protein S18 acetylase RimI-like enzyme